ncbi:MAG: radical SAM protein [Eggerthellaceae bacterium]|nr:radical SAM protein [Eggerthellaceae bacterium]
MNNQVQKPFDIDEYMTKGVEQIVKTAVKATLTNPAESAFMARFAAASAIAAKKRTKAERMGEHVPAFLIASITGSCNLHCAGCYSRANHACGDEAALDQLSDVEWRKIFDEADDLGVSFILLAGGEPMMRSDVIKQAGEVSNILFPVFTNGTMFDDCYLEMFKQHRNLVPIVSIEGHEEKTDSRRGSGVYELVNTSMRKMNDAGLIFGASITVTTENLEEVYSDGFIESLRDKGVKAILYIEYVPVTEESIDLAPGDEERAFMQAQMARIRDLYPEIVFIAFPGDEKDSGGCVAAGRGFFHINSHGGAEPCPFSPYSDINVRDSSLKEAIQSRLFKMLRDNGTLLDDHVGGCTLFAKKEEVERYLAQTA